MFQGNEMIYTLIRTGPDERVPLKTFCRYERVHIRAVHRCEYYYMVQKYMWNVETRIRVGS
jgi:hypothetical protein